MASVRSGGAGRGGRRGFADKAALLAGGSAVSALTYERASADKRKQGKSVTDQRRLNHADVAGHGWRLVESFVDNDRSASRHAKKARPDFERLIEAIESGRGDVLVMWEMARGQRDLAVYVQICDLCMRAGLNFWSLGGSIYDLRDRVDRMSLSFQAVQSEDQADYIRDNVLRGVEGAALSGRPPGALAYGYARLYDQKTRALLAQSPDTEPREATAEDGTVAEYSPAEIVVEIFTRISEGHTLTGIARDLNARGVPGPKGNRWSMQTLRSLALNQTYIGKRSLRGQVITDGIWAPLVDEELFWSVARTLGDPQRSTVRPGRAVWLLTHLATAGKCGGTIGVHRPPRAEGDSGARLAYYVCKRDRCASIRVDVLDEYVQEVVVEWLSRPEVYDALRAATSHNDAQAATARAEAAKLRTELEDWRKDAEARRVTRESFGRMERALTRDIAKAEERAQEAGVPPILRGMIGPDAAAKWDALGDNIAVKREIIRTITTIALHPAEHRHGVPVEHRVSFGGLYAGQTDSQIMRATN